MNGKGVWFGLAMALLGIILAGMTFDFIGSGKVAEAKQELEERIDRTEERTQRELQRIYRALERIEDKLEK